jgi:hypothetical protein
LRSLQDREGHRAVDEEHADDQREQPERREIRAKCRRELAEGVVLVCRGHEHRAARRRRPELARLQLGQL